MDCAEDAGARGAVAICAGKEFMKENPIVNGIRYCGRTSGKEPRVFASLELQRRHTYGKQTSFGERTVWRRFSYRELGIFPTKAEAKSAVKAALDSKRVAATPKTPAPAQ